MHIADMDGDGDHDIIVQTEVHKLAIVKQAEDGSFLGSHKSYFYETSSAGGTSVIKALSIGDVNGDGLPDTVVTWSDDGLFVLPNVTE